jgi:hypothetical protein
VTGNGRLRRDAIVGRYGWLIDSMYRDGESARRRQARESETLVRETGREREFLLSAPVIRRCLGATWTASSTSVS